jgi:SPP1 family predicted phage head-tail adaptor
MRAGKLRHRLKIQSKTTALDSFGGGAATWSTFANVYGSVEPLTGRERFDAQQVNPEVNHVVRIRYLDGVVPEQRILWGSVAPDIEETMDFDDEEIKRDVFGSHALYIDAVLDVGGRKRELQLLCKESP